MMLVIVGVGEISWSSRGSAAKYYLSSGRFLSPTRFRCLFPPLTLCYIVSFSLTVPPPFSLSLSIFPFPLFLSLQFCKSAAAVLKLKSANFPLGAYFFSSLRYENEHFCCNTEKRRGRLIIVILIK